MIIVADLKASRYPELCTPSTATLSSLRLFMSLGIFANRPNFIAETLSPDAVKLIITRRTMYSLDGQRRSNIDPLLFRYGWREKQLQGRSKITIEDTPGTLRMLQLIRYL